MFNSGVEQNAKSIAAFVVVFFFLSFYYARARAFQEKNQRRTRTHIGRRDGNRILVRCGNGVRVADAFEHRSRPSAHDTGMGRVALHRVLRHSHTGIIERQVQPSVGPAQAVSSDAGLRSIFR